MARFTGKTAVITGGASGIGAASVRRFHAEGANVVIADVDDESGEALSLALGARAIFHHVDVANYDKVEALMALAVEKYGALDILFNNAGIGCFGITPDLPIEEWQRVIEIDLNGVFYGCKAAIPHMRKIGGGTIINTASASGLAGDYAHTAYNAAKGGVVNYTRAAAIDHAREGIRINAVCPGPVETPIVSPLLAIPQVVEAWNERIPMGRWAKPEEIAAVAAFLASEDASYITGAMLVVDGGLGAHTGQPNLTSLLSGES